MNQVNNNSNSDYDKYFHNIRLVTTEKKISKSELQQMAKDGFGDMVKAVVDTKLKVMVVGGELHSDEEEWLLEWNPSSQQQNLWGINLYPVAEEKNFIEFDSLINIRPLSGNRSRDVEDEKIREQIIEVVNLLIQNE